MNYSKKNAFLKTLFLGFCFSVGSIYVAQGMEQVAQKVETTAEVDKAVGPNIDVVLQKKITEALNLLVEKYEKQVKRTQEDIDDIKNNNTDLTKSTVLVTIPQLIENNKNIVNVYMDRFAREIEKIKNGVTAEAERAFSICVYSILVKFCSSDNRLTKALTRDLLNNQKVLKALSIERVLYDYLVVFSSIDFIGVMFSKYENVRRYLKAKIEDGDEESIIVFSAWKMGAIENFKKALCKNVNLVNKEKCCNSLAKVSKAEKQWNRDLSGYNKEYKKKDSNKTIEKKTEKKNTFDGRIYDDRW